jgi:signal transduction histidine kinase
MFELSPPILYELGLEEAIEWLAEHFSQEYQIKIQVSKDEQPKPLKGERNIILFQSLKELLSNIVKHSQATIVKISIQRACNDFRIIVEDNGIGFDEKQLNRIFAPFERLHGRSSQYEGMGMGLAICKKIVERHGGSITANSTPGSGATFIISLPGIQTKVDDDLGSLIADHPDN